MIDTPNTNTLQPAVQELPGCDFAHLYMMRQKNIWLHIKTGVISQWMVIAHIADWGKCEIGWDISDTVMKSKHSERYIGMT